MRTAVMAWASALALGCAARAPVAPVTSPTAAATSATPLAPPTADAATSATPTAPALGPRTGELVVGLKLAEDAAKLPALLRPEALGVVCEAGEFASQTMRLVRCTRPDGAALSSEELARVRKAFAARPEVAFAEANDVATAQPR